jgi:predicted enzyme related to lactoylglutathione lyase
MSNVIVWADIPVVDLERARKFYAHVLGNEIQMMPGSDAVALLMPLGTGSPDDVSGDLVQDSDTPSKTHGSTVYLNSNGDISGMLARVVEAGGSVLSEPVNMGEMVGWIAFFEDSEGNRVGLHQPA